MNLPHHVIISQGTAIRRGDDVLVPAFIDGALRPYGELVPGTVVVLPEDNRAPLDMMVALDRNVWKPLLWPGITAGGAFRRSWAYGRSRLLLRDLVGRAEFVLLYLPNTLGLVAGMAALAANTPVYLDLAGTLRHPPDAVTLVRLRTRLAGHLYSYRAERKLAAVARLIISVSPHLFETFPPSDAPKVVVTHSTISEDAIHERKDACTRGSLGLFVAAVLRESKGIQHLIRAVRVLADESWDVSLNIAGPGAYMSELKRLAAELRVDARVTFLGAIQNGEPLWRYYREADISVLPTLGHYEGSPRMIIESWAGGSPVIASAIGGIPALVNHEENGLLVPPGDVPALVAAIKRIYLDAALRQRLVANGYVRVRDMTYEGRLCLLRDAFAKHLPGLLPERP